jgi:hypothetical protein
MQEYRRIQLRVGDFYRLNSSLGPIPAGIYRLEEFDHITWEFSVGKSRQIRFFIMFGTAGMISRVTRKSALSGRTREREFAAEYYARLKGVQLSRTMPPIETGPISGCIMPLKYELLHAGPMLNSREELQ